MQFSSASYNANENVGSMSGLSSAAVNTSGVSTVNYRRVIAQERAIATCSIVVAANLRCDYETKSGRLTFAAGEMSEDGADSAR